MFWFTSRNYYIIMNKFGVYIKLIYYLFGYL
jgi:hypothetical protein